MILIIGGTEDALKLGCLIKKKGYDVSISAATKYGKELVKEYGLNVFSQKLGGEQMDKVLEKTGIQAVIDSSHPYSTQVTYNSLKACQKLNLPIIRYERPETKIPEGNGKEKKIFRVKDFSRAGEKAFQLGGNILLTTGSKNLASFIEALKERSSNENDKNLRLYVRILPEKESISKCQELGITPEKILAIKGPLSYDFNKVIMENYHINTMITKDSGHTGGTYEKIKAALDLDINVILIERPDYKKFKLDITSSREKILEWLAKINS